MQTTFYLSLLLAVFHTAAHSQLPASDHSGHDPNDPKHHIHHGGEAIACLKLVPNNADFAFQFFRELTQETTNKNIFFSPVSISSAFAMLALGARSATQSQILEGLAFNLTEIQEKEIHEGFQNLIHMLNHPEGGVQLNMGNAIFVTEKLKLLEKFLDDTKVLYQMEAFTTDFNKPTEAEKQINDYIERKTHGKITNVVKDLDPQTVMLLASFVFFKGEFPLGFPFSLFILINKSNVACLNWKLVWGKLQMLFSEPEDPLMAQWRWWRGDRTPLLDRGRQLEATQTCFSLWQLQELCSKPQPSMQPELVFLGLTITPVVLHSSDFQWRHWDLYMT